MEVGYQHGRTLLAGMKAVQQDRKMKVLISGGVSSPPQEVPSSKPTTFTDLASIVCRVKKPVKEVNVCDDDDMHSDNFFDETDMSQEEI